MDSTKIRFALRVATAFALLEGGYAAASTPVDVDCTAGQSVNAALSAHADDPGLLTIHVSGTCTETVIITRSNVALLGQGTGATIQAPSTTAFSILVENAVRQISVANVTLTDGHGAASVSKNAHAVFTNVIAEHTNVGLVNTNNATMEITSSVIRNNNVGVYAARNATTLVSNSTVENNTIGLLAFKGGTINVTSLLPDGTVGAGVLVRTNRNGGVARSGGVIELSDATIQNNQLAGLFADSVSALHFFNPFNGTGNSLAGNAVGVQAQKNAALVFSDATNSITGNAIGLQCHADASYVLSAGSPGTVTGNTTANIVGCAP